MRRPNDPYEFTDEELMDSLALEAEEEMQRKKTIVNYRELTDIWKEVFGDEETT